MNNLYKLRNHIKHYEWGSPALIPQLMGLAIDGEPWAEMWMGSHPGAPSLVSAPAGAPVGEITLGEFIASDPRMERFGALPFLFKLLAVEKPLSIQVHPNSDQAREGFERENRANLALDAANRNYKDANHKPEIICALSSFTGMCGFREIEEIRLHLLNIVCLKPSPSVLLKNEVLYPLIDALKNPDPDSAMRFFLETLFSLSQEARKALTEFILATNAAENTEWRLMREFARLYPCDPGIIAPLYLNVFHLEPGEALFLQAGVLHAYIHGLGVELMANSDNVLRGGLTRKHIDIPELMEVIDLAPSKLNIIKPEPVDGRFSYPGPCEEFSLTVIRGTDGKIDLAPDTPSICIVTEGEVAISGIVLKQGESAFIIPPADKAALPLVAQGPYTLYIASGAGNAKPSAPAEDPTPC